MLYFPNLSYHVRREYVRIFTDTMISRSHSYSFSLDYTWIDQNRKQVKLPAPTYIDYVMTWVQNMLDDEGVFPTKAGKLFMISGLTLV